MPRLEERDYTYFTTVRGMCRGCRRVGPARVFLRGGSVWQESLCPTCANEPALIARDEGWYLTETLAARPDHAPLPGARAPARGCPGDCGPCAWHASGCRLPVVPVTNVCDLSCPICFTCGRSDRPYHMSAGELRAVVDDLVAAHAPLELISITGGEPTCHPDIVPLLQVCARPGIGRVAVHSNGLRLAADPGLCARIAEAGAQVILSFDTFDPAASARLRGRDLVDTKLKAIDNLTAAGVRMAILHAMVRGVNEDAVGGILDMMRANDLILGLTVQTMTRTGPRGGPFPDRRHIPVDEAAGIVCRQSRGELAFADFVPGPSAHPLCSLTSHVLKHEESFVPLARSVPRERIDSLTADSSARTICIHARMDEDTFDCARAASCPDLVLVEPGRLVPACTYDLFHRTGAERCHDAG